MHNQIKNHGTVQQYTFTIIHKYNATYLKFILQINICFRAVSYVHHSQCDLWQLPLVLFHLHCNNYCSVCGKESGFTFTVVSTETLDHKTSHKLYMYI